jgi:hypothetical protein
MIEELGNAHFRENKGGWLFMLLTPWSFYVHAALEEEEDEGEM